MKLNSLVLLASVVVLGACAGSDKSAAKTDSAAAPMAAPAPAAGATAAAPVTGKTIDVNMQLDGTTYHFVPNTITVKAGDAIRFHNVSGGPHNVGFDATTIPANVQTVLAANMPGDHSMGALEGPLLLQPSDTYTVSFANVPAGTYAFHCFPHLALGMKGTITVQ